MESLQDSQNVHSWLQMRAFSLSGGSGSLHFSQDAFISSAIVYLHRCGITPSTRLQNSASFAILLALQLLSGGAPFTPFACGAFSTLRLLIAMEIKSGRKRGEMFSNLQADST